MIQVYSLYKQSAEGDINVDEPTNSFDFLAKTKFNAWQQLKGKPTVIAMQEYIDLVNILKG